MEKILIVRKMSALEYHYKMEHASEELKEGHEENDASIRKIEGMLRDSGIEYDIVTRNVLPQTKFENYTKVISGGGDGTVIAVAAYNQNLPQLNLKTDKRSKGVLCNADLEKSVESMLKGDFKVEPWTRQDVYLDKRIVGRALNETCVGEEMDFSKMTKYYISMETPSGKKIQDYHRNSGLIMVTGTGSTGWGPAFEPYPRSDKLFKFTTIIQNVGTLNKGEFSSCSLIYKNHLGKFAIDTVKYDLPRDSVLEIRLSEFPLQIVIPKI